MKKRIISLILALALCVGMLPAPAWAEEPTDPTQPVGVVKDTNPSEETDPTTEPTEEETEPTEEETEPTEEETDPTEEETDPTEGLQDQTIPEEVAAYAASLPETISGTVTLDNYQGTETLKLDQDTTLVLKGENKIECQIPLDLNGHELIIQGTGSLELVGSNNSGATPPTSGAIYDSTWTSTSTSSTGRMVIESGTVIARDDVKNAVAVRYLYMEGGKLEAYGVRSGIVTTQLKITGGSLYATGSTRNGIDMWNPYYVSVNGLNILVSDEPDAQEANMEDGTTSQIEDSKKKTVAIGKFSTSPSISVQAQQGYLYEATAKTATFALSGRNVDLSALNLTWTGAHTGLEASADGKTVTVTTDKTVQAGTYGLKVSAGGASRTAVVTVSGPPICIYERPVDTISTDPEAGEVHVSAYLTKGHSGFIDFQWKQEDGTVMDGYTGENVPLIDLVELEMLTQDASKPWLQTIRIYCTLSYDGYSLNTETVTLGLNSCKHEKVDHEGNCTQCGQKKGGNGDALIVGEDGLYYLIADAESGDANVGHFMYMGGNFWLTGDVQKTTVDVSNPDVGGKNVTLDLQEHTMKNLKMGNFPYGTFTVKNGTLGEIGTSASGKLILENISYQGKWFDDQFELTVQGENTRFERQVTFWGTTHLRGGLFSQGLDSDCAGRALELLEDGFAFYDNDNKVVDATDSTRLVGRKIHVAAHTCDYRYGKCACGRSCDHVGKVNADGYCTVCHALVEPYAIGEDKYTSLEDALAAAKDGNTITLRGDFNQGSKTVEIDKSVTLDLGGHTLTSDADGAPVLRVLAENVTIRNGTVKNTRTAKSSPAVMVGKFDATGMMLTVKNVNFIGSITAVTPRASALSVQPSNVAKVESGTFTGGISVNGSLTLSGGKADHIYVGTGVTYASLLAKGYAYQVSGQLVKPENMADGIAVEVVKCGHPDGLTGTEACAYCGLKCNHPGIDSTTGNCTVCGLFQATASVAAGGTTTYFADFSEALDAAKAASGSTLTLLRDVALTGENSLYINSGTFTIDWNGHTLSGSPENYLMVISDLANVTLKDSSGNNTGGACQTGYGMAVHIAVGSEGSVKIQGGTYSPNVTRSQRCYGSVQISGGVFANPQGHGMNCALFDLSGNHLSGMLADGTAFAYEADGSDLLDAYNVNMSDSFRTVYVVEHTHENWTDGVCDCGYLCPHAEVDEEGGCTLCGKRFYVQGTYADGTTHYYGTISDALGDSAVTQAKILRALTEECESWNGGDRSVTLDLNGWNLVVESIQGGHLILRDSSGIGSILAVKEIQKDGQVTVESGRLAPQGETLSVYGKLTVTGGKVDSLTAMEGSTVSLSGGSFGKIAGSGVTLRSLLAENYYYAELNGETPKSYADTDTVIEGVSVVPCDHTSVRENKGTYFSTYTCNCGKVTYRLTVTVGENNPEYFREYNDAFAYAAKKDGVVRFLTNGVNGTIEVNAQGTVTIDMEHRSYRADDRRLVIKSGSTVRLVGQGSVMSTPEPGSGGSGSGKLEYGEFIPVTVEAGGTFVLPAEKLGGGENMAKPTNLTVQSGGTAELQGGSTHWTDVYGTLKISGGSHRNIHQYDQGQLNITGGDIKQLQIYGDLPRNALSGGSYGIISAWESNPRESVTEKLRNVTFADFQNMLASGKVFQNTTNQSYPNQVETDQNYGFYYYKKDLSNVRVTAAPFTGVEVVCQLGAHTYEERVSTQYNVGEMDSSGNVVFRLGVRTQPQEIQSGVTVQWYQLGAEDSRTPVGTGQTCPLDTKLPVGTHRFLAVVNCSGYVLESQPFAVTVTPRVVNITGGFTAQDRDYVPDETTVTITKGTVTFDKKAEGDDLGAQVHGGTVATPDAGQNKAVTYSATLTGEDKDNYTLGSVPELTVTIRPIAQTLAFAEAAVTKTYGDSPFVNALTHSVGDGQITYTSSDPAVATVGTDGTVTILKSGTAKITAEAGATQNYVETSVSFDLTVTKAKGTLVNKDYPTQFTYGDTVPTPKAENFTTNNLDGAFDYYWVTETGTMLDAGANPTLAGTYTLYATLTEGTNHTAANLSLPVTIQKANQTADITVVNETISGKGDGGVTLLPSAEGYEIREKGVATFESISASQGETFHTLIPGVYEIRLAETKNYLPSATQEVTVQPGRKLKVTLPTKQEGYTLTANKTQLGWHENVELTFQLNPVGAYKAADFGIWAEAGSGEKTKLTLGNDGAVKLTAPEKDITITVTGVKTDNVAPQASIRGRLRKDSGYYVKWEGFQENPTDDFVNGDFVISATDRVSGVADFWYCLSDKPLTLEELKGMNGAFWARPANQGRVSITEDGVYYLYAKALDKANNAGYACTGKLVKESNPPTFSGVENEKTYYVSQQMEIHDDGMPDWYRAEGSIGVVPNGGNENPVKLQLPNNGSSYTFTVGDRCGNEATITVYMKPLSDLTQPLDRIQEETIRKSDRATLDEVEATLKGLDVTYATEPEKKEINDALARIAQLRAVLDQVAAVEAQIDALPDSVEPYQQTVEDTQIKPARDAYNSLTDHQKTLVDSTKLDKLVRLEAQLNAWTITEGDGQTWYKGSGKSLSFTVNGQTRKFSKVLLDGKMPITATPSFLAVSGSIDEPFTLTLKPEFLQVWMEPGEHTLTVIYGENNSGTGTVTFTVEIPANYLDVTNKPEFDGKTTVTVDGAEYPIEGMNGTRYVNLPETGDLLTIYSFKDGTPAGSHTNYPTGMQVFRITRQEGGAKAEEITEFANLLNYAGCSIRISGKKGIRMITGIDQDVKKSLVSKAGLAGYTLEEYGTVVQWADTLGSNTLNLDNSNKQNYAYKKGKADPIFSRANGMIQYTNVLVGFSLEDCAKDLILRPYIKLKDMTTGETVTLYGGSVCRSIGYIAKQNENTYQPGSSGYKYVHKIINAVYGKTEQGG